MARLAFARMTAAWRPAAAPGDETVRHHKKPRGMEFFKPTPMWMVDSVINETSRDIESIQTATREGQQEREAAVALQAAEEARIAKANEEAASRRKEEIDGSSC